MLIGESNVAIDPAIGGYGVADIYLGEFSPQWPISTLSPAEGWANLTTRVFYCELLLHRSALDTRCIDSNIREWEIHI